MKRILLIIYLAATISISGQSLAKDLDFIESLFKGNDFQSAILYINQELKSEKNDSIQFLKAWAFYNLDQQDSARKNFESVSNKYNDLYVKSKFFSSASAYLSNKIKLSDSLLHNINHQLLDANHLELLAVQKAGISLLRRDIPAFKLQKENFQYNNYNFSNEEKQLEIIAQTLTTHKKKKPIIAALLSAILPGSGKWYAGSKGQAVSSFFSCLLPAAVATEAYIKAGPKSGLFISSAIVTSLFYSGSIVGSAFTAKE